MVSVQLSVAVGVCDTLPPGPRATPTETGCKYPFGRQQLPLLSSAPPVHRFTVLRRLISRAGSDCAPLGPARTFLPYPARLRRWILASQDLTSAFPSGRLDVDGTNSSFQLNNGWIARQTPDSTRAPGRNTACLPPEEQKYLPPTVQPHLLPIIMNCQDIDVLIGLKCV